VIGAIFNDRHEILLACHTYRGNKPWGLPGGVAGYHESPAEAIVREIREELGVPVRVSRLIDVIYTEKRIYLEIAYECVIAQANYEFHYNPEVSEARFFPLDQLPLDLMLKEHHRTFTHILELLKTREAETSLESS
jgi:ADP-ribose pyrophosphatase YjhB (NUDIX family)